jgi:hypothetical protein
MTILQLFKSIYTPPMINFNHLSKIFQIEQYHVNNSFILFSLLLIGFIGMSDNAACILVKGCFFGIIRKTMN